jgi:hypothetical protein
MLEKSNFMLSSLLTVYIPGSAPGCEIANHRQILPFQLKQVKTYEKSETSKKAILTHSSEPQSNLEQLFFGANSKSKNVISVVCANANKK